MAECLLRRSGAFHDVRSSPISAPIPMRKQLTGEPVAGELHTGFGGRGRRQPFPTPIQRRLSLERHRRRTVATRIAEALDVGGEQLIKRVLGHSDGSVTAIYNRYGYVKEMRAVLTQWASDLLGNESGGKRHDLSSFTQPAGAPSAPSLTREAA